MKKSDNCPMQSAHNAPRCTAKSKRTGKPCKAPAIKGWSVCRMHGAKGGSRSGREANAYKHGDRTASSIELRKAVNEVVRGLDLVRV